jgi:hypothetical protein
MREKLAFPFQTTFTTDRGLTRREVFALSCLNGILSTQVRTNDEVMVDWAITLADLLIKQLDSPPNAQNPI